MLVLGYSIFDETRRSEYKLVLYAGWELQAEQVSSPINDA